MLYLRRELMVKLLTKSTGREQTAKHLFGLGTFVMNSRIRVSPDGRRITSTSVTSAPTASGFRNHQTRNCQGIQRRRELYILIFHITTRCTFTHLRQKFQLLK